MEPVATVVAFGFERLFLEVLAAALSPHGWRVIDADQTRSDPHETIDIALVFSYWSADTVVAWLRRARSQFPAARIVLFGVQAADKEFLRFIEGGMKGWVSRGQGLAELHETLLQVRQNRTSASGRITLLVLNNIGALSGQNRADDENHLTPRQSEILRLIGEGMGNKEIANCLSIAPNTVKNHVHHLLEKLQVRNRHEAAWTRSQRDFPPPKWAGKRGA